jgi:serine/threonine-protein kinase HipA
VLGEPVSEDFIDEAWAVVLGLDTGRPLPPDLENRVRANTGMGGARPKLTVSDGAHQWLAKFPSHRDDRRYSQARLEAATLDLAGLCGINSVQARLKDVRAADGQEGVVLLVKRFDRTLAPGAGRGWLRDAYVSGRTLLTSEQALRAGQFMGTYPQLAVQFTRWSGNAAADRLQLFRRMAFNCSVSNTDDHDRNHGLLADELGDMRLSPAFDIVPRLHGTARRHQAMGIGAEGTLATVDNLVSAAGEFGILETEARAIIDDVQHGVASHWKACLENRGMTPAEVALLYPCFGELPKNAAELERIIIAKRATQAPQADVPVPRSGPRP